MNNSTPCIDTLRHARNHACSRPRRDASIGKVPGQQKGTCVLSRRALRLGAPGGGSAPRPRRRACVGIIGNNGRRRRARHGNLHGRVTATRICHRAGAGSKSLHTSQHWEVATWAAPRTRSTREYYQCGRSRSRLGCIQRSSDSTHRCARSSIIVERTTRSRLSTVAHQHPTPEHPALVLQSLGHRFSTNGCRQRSTRRG